MEPKIVKTGEMLLVGFSFYGDPFEIGAGWTEGNAIGRLWQRFMTYIASYPERIKHVKNPHLGYEVHLETEDTATRGEREVFVGMEVAKLEDVPVDVLVKILPPTEYAVFTLEGEQIVDDWYAVIYEDWLPGSGYITSQQYMIQRYDERFKGLDRIAESFLDVYVPVERQVSQ
jgi:predicted transcriptional regulator YdeE